MKQYMVIVVDMNFDESNKELETKPFYDEGWRGPDLNIIEGDIRKFLLGSVAEDYLDSVVSWLHGSNHEPLRLGDDFWFFAEIDL